MADPPGRVTDASTPVQTTHNPFHGIFDKVSHAATSAASAVSEKAHEVANDPNVKKQVQNGTHVAGNIGTGVVNGLKTEGQETVAAARRGDVVGVATHVAPMMIGGGVPAIVVREVAPRVVAEGLKQLPPGTRQQIESSGAGRMALGAAEHGRIPTSPADLARLGTQYTKESALQGALHNFHQGPTAAAGAPDQARLSPQGIKDGALQAALTNFHQLRPAPQRPTDQTIASAPHARPTDQTVASAPPAALRIAETIAPKEAKPNIVNSNQVFPDWMRQAQTVPPKH